MMPIFVSIPWLHHDHGTTIELRVRPSSTIFEVKMRAGDEAMHRLDHHSLTYAGRKLADHWKLSDCNIPENATLFCIK